EFRAPSGTAPVLGRGDQGTADTMAAPLGLDVPALEIRHAIGVAVLGVGANVQLGEANRPIALADGEQDCQRLLELPGEESLDLGGMIAGSIRPQRLAHAKPRR